MFAPLLLLQVLLFVLQAVVRSRRRRRRRSRFFSCVPLFWQFSTFPQSPQQRQQQQISHAAMQFIIKIIVSCSQSDGPGGGAWQGRRCLPKKKMQPNENKFFQVAQAAPCVCLNKMKVFARQSLTHIEGSLPVSQSLSLSVSQSISLLVSLSVSQSGSQTWQQTLFSGSSSRKREVFAASSSSSATVVAVSIFVLISFSNALRYCFLLALD